MSHSKLVLYRQLMIFVVLWVWVLFFLATFGIAGGRG
jgi:hypothetical protein